MKTLVNIVDDDIYQLDRLSVQRGVSRSHLIREAIAQFIIRETEPVEDVYGLFKTNDYKNIEGEDYQSKLRNEW